MERERNRENKIQIIKIKLAWNMKHEWVSVGIFSDNDV